MSDKIFLKDITLPIVETGENETYSFVQTDSDLETAGDAADAKKTGDEITQLKADLSEAQTALETKANIDGSYDTMTVGNAKQLTSNVGINDRAPYLFRTAGGANDIGDREEDTIVGGSLVWNQLQKSPSEGGTYQYQSAGSISYDGDTVINTAVSANAIDIRNRESITFQKDHKYVFSYDVKCSEAVSVKAYLKYNLKSTIAITANTWTRHSIVTAWFAENENTFWDVVTASAVQTGSTLQIKNVVLTDLTVLFGTAIADYIYTVNFATVGSGIAWLRKYGFFTKDYYPYTEPTFKHVEGLTSHRMVGFNQFDKDTATLYYGFLQTQENNIYVWRQANDSRSYVVKCMPNTVYCVYFNGSAPTLMRVGDTPSDELPTTPTTGGWEIPLGKAYSSVVSGESRVIYTTSNNAKWLIVQLGSSLIPSRSGDICISLHWDGERDGEYEAYKEYTYPLDDSLILRGIPKLDVNNDLYYDGDRYLPDGTVERNWHEVSSGDCTVGVYTGTRWKLTLPNTAPGRTRSTSSRATDIICSYPFTVMNKSNVSNGTLYALSYSDGSATKDFIFTLDSSAITTVEQAQEWVTNHPFTLVYPVDTPITETADPFQTPQVVDDWGTEEYVYTDGAFPIPVGHDTFYAANLKAKLEMAPDSPGDGDGDYIVRQTNGLNEYVKMVKELPSTPTTDGSYHLEVTVASGTPTLTWVADE